MGTTAPEIGHAVLHTVAVLTSDLMLVREKTWFWIASTKLLSARYDGPPKAGTLKAELVYMKPPADLNRKEERKVR